MWRGALPLLLLLNGPAKAQPVSDADLNDSLDLGQEIEARADGDLNGDSAIDTAYLVRSEDARTLHVLLGPPRETAPRYRPVGTLILDVASLGPADLSIAKGLLKIEDLTGGTTAISAIYRFRLDPRVQRLRLIGLDATLYSRTFAHDGYEMSWNLLTGAAITSLLRVGKPGSDTGYDKLFTTRSTRVHKPLYMEDVPDPELLMVELRGK